MRRVARGAVLTPTYLQVRILREWTADRTYRPGELAEFREHLAKRLAAGGWVEIIGEVATSAGVSGEQGELWRK